jgi:undecaprenyl-diphosphatase
MDASLFRSINRFADRTSWAHGFFRAYANYGIALFGVLLVVVYLQARQRNDLRGVAGTVWAAIAALVGLGLAQVIGGAVNRARPYAAMPNIHVLIDKTTDFSFPSDHATTVGAVAVGLFLVNRRWGLAAGGLAVVMAFARVYAGAHYPGDVLAGLVLGGTAAAVGSLVAVPLLHKVAAWLRGTALRPTVARSAVVVDAA